MSHEHVEQARQQKDTFFQVSPQSPLTMEQKGIFTGLNYYDWDSDLDLIVTVTPFKTQEPVQVITTDHQIRNYTRFAEFSFTVDGKQAWLTIYQTEHGSFYLSSMPMPERRPTLPGVTWTRCRLVATYSILTSIRRIIPSAHIMTPGVARSPHLKTVSMWPFGPGKKHLKNDPQSLGLDIKSGLSGHSA